MSWVATGAMTTVILAALGVLSFWVAHSIEALGGSLRRELGSDIAGLRGELGSEISGLRGELGSEISGLRSDIRRLEDRLTSIETKVLDDHGQRIARLEERTGS